MIVLTKPDSLLPVPPIEDFKKLVARKSFYGSPTQAEITTTRKKLIAALNARYPGLPF